MSFREHAARWLDENAPVELLGTATSPFQGHWGGARGGFPSEAHRLWFERSLARGWTAPGWPTTYGGGGLSVTDHRTLLELLRERGLPMPLVGFGLTMIGPILLAEGDEAQKQAHLPAIVRGEVRWCQGYSEPDAGSDLASLRTRAVQPEGADHLVVTGQKVWTSHAELADWIFCLVRTDPNVKKQEGISFVLIDMTTPGIRVRPILLISGQSPFCEVYLDEVPVPLTNVVGGIHRGWSVAKSLLRHERNMVGESVASGGSRPESLRDYSVRDHALSTVGATPDGALADPLLRDAIADNEMERECLQLTLKRSRDRVATGAAPGPESSIMKVVGTELNQRFWELAMRVAGPAGVDDEVLASAWLRSRGNTIEGGTTEVQLNIVAQTVLGLPR